MWLDPGVRECGDEASASPWEPISFPKALQRIISSAVRLSLPPRFCSLGLPREHCPDGSSLTLHLAGEILNNNTVFKKFLEMWPSKYWASQFLVPIPVPASMWELME